MKHTPGPWVLDREGHQIVSVPTGRVITFEIVLPPVGGHPTEEDANACLIEAAPEMLDALEGAGCICEHGIGNPMVSSHSKTCLAIQAAIIKAKGDGS